MPSYFRSAAQPILPVKLISYTIRYIFSNNCNAYTCFYALSVYSIAQLLQKINTI